MALYPKVFLCQSAGGRRKWKSNIPLGETTPDWRVKHVCGGLLGASESEEMLGL